MADSSLPKTSAPAGRALANAGVNNLHDLSKFSLKEIAALHGMGPKALRILEEAMKNQNLQFKNK